MVLFFFSVNTFLLKKVHEYNGKYFLVQEIDRLNMALHDTKLFHYFNSLCSTENCALHIIP